MRPDNLALTHWFARSRTLLLTLLLTVLSGCQILSSPNGETDAEVPAVELFPACAPPGLFSPPRLLQCSAADWLLFNEALVRLPHPQSALAWWSVSHSDVSHRIAMGLYHSQTDTSLVMRHLGLNLLAAAEDDDLPRDLQTLLHQRRRHSEQALALMQQRDARLRAYQAQIATLQRRQADLEQARSQLQAHNQRLQQLVVEKQRQIEALTELESQLSDDQNLRDTEMDISPEPETEDNAERSQPDE